VTAQPVLFALPIDAARCRALILGERCGRPAATYLRVGCEHEHVFVVVACARCAARTSEMGHGCASCLAGPDPHECRMTGVPIDSYDLPEVA
jgi:hypothetical protein